MCIRDRYKGYVQARDEGQKINGHIRHSKKFRNPCLLDKLVAFLGVHEFGSNYPPELYDPKAFKREEHYDALEEARREWEHKQSRKQGERVEFRASSSATQLESAPSRPAGLAAAPAAAAAAATAVAAAQASAASASAAAADGAAPPKRKSKWDSVGTDKKP